MENEILDKLRKRLAEEVNKITRLEVFDFDGTLISTPLPEFGKPIWEKEYGQKWPHVGWWSRVESLDQRIFEMKPLAQVAAANRTSTARPDTMNIMMTGRRGDKTGATKFANLMGAVKAVLDKNGFTFDGYYYNTRGETSAYKIGELNRILNANPNIVDVTLYDDRDQHIPTFQTWGDELVANGRLTNFTMNHIKGEHHSPID